MNLQNKPEDINVCFISDNGYVIPTAVAIASLKENRNKKNRYNIFIILVDGNEKNEKILEEMTDENFLVNTIRVSSDQVRKYDKIDSSICAATSSAVLKFRLPEILKKLDKVLFLDGDILIFNDLFELYNQEIDDCYAAVVIDSGSIYYKHEFVKKVEHYFNSGVMLLNLKKARTENLTKTLFETKERLVSDNLMDQNVFNIIFNNKIKLLPIKYNLLIVNLKRAKDKYKISEINECYGTTYSNIEEIEKDAVIIHYSSKDKPWKNINNYGAEKWRYYFLKSPYSMKRRSKLMGYRWENIHYKVIERKENKQENCLVSVIIPVYNTKQYLTKSINSILMQTLKNIEVILIDDASTDGSLEILKKYLNIDNRISLISAISNYGQSAARNFGLQIAKGKYVYFFDSDDLLEIDALDRLVNCAEKNSADVVYFSGTALYSNENLKKKHPEYLSYYKKENNYSVADGVTMYGDLVENHDYNVSPCLQLLNKDFLLKNKIKFYEGIILEDNIFSLEVILNANRAVAMKDILFLRNVRADSTVTSRRNYRHYEGLLVVIFIFLKYLNKYNSSQERIYSILAMQIRQYIKTAANIYKSLNIYEKNDIYELDREFKVINDTYILIQSNNIPANINNNLSKQVSSVDRSYRSLFHGGVKCLREHGLIYTVRRIKEKLLHK